MLLTNTLITLNIVVFLLSLTAPELLMRYTFTTGDFLAGEWYRALTSIFLHDPTTFSHLAANTLALFFLGGVVEKHLKSYRYLLVYLLSGVAGNLILLLPIWRIPPDVPALGASGAISGLVGVGAFVCPWEQVFLAPWWIPMPFMMVGVLYFLSTLSGLLGPPTAIAYEAHLAGLVVGMSFGLTWGTHKLRRGIIFFLLIVLLLALPWIFAWAFG